MAASVTSVNFESTRSMRLSVRGSISEARRSAMVVTFRQGSGGRSGLPAALQDSSDLTSRPISVVVHDHGVEAVGGLLLLLGEREAALDGSRVVLPPIEQPAPLLLPRGCVHEHEHRIRVLLAHRERAVDVNLEEDVAVCLEVLVDWPSRRPVEIAVDLEPLEEPAFLANPLELAPVEEQAVLAVGLTGAARARGRRDREPQARLELEELAHDRPLADPGRAREDQQDAQGLPPISRNARAALRAGCDRG